MTAAPEHHSNNAALRRIRALLAKAESTTFGPEAEALIAKAQDLMTRHSINAAMLRADGAGPGPTSISIVIDNPYWRSKGALLSRIANANHCRSVWLMDANTIQVFGFAVDLENVDVMFTSLLVQATRALAREEAARPSSGDTKSFRKAFLDGFAVRVGQRLSEAAAASIQEEEGVRGPGILPVLVRREEQVENAVDDTFPMLSKMKMSAPSNFSGFLAGQRAAEKARLSGPRRLSA